MKIKDTSIPSPTRKKQAAEPVAAVAKALATLRAFVDGQEKWGVRELGAALGLPPSTVHRLLSRLRMEGFVGYESLDQKYHAGFEFCRLAAAVMQRNVLRQAALPVLHELTERTGESVWLALYDNDQHRTAYIAESESPHASHYIAPLGRAQGLADSACGIAILANLPPEERKEALRSARGRMLQEARAAIAAAEANGFAVLRAGEVEAAMMVAAAVLDSAGRPLGSLGVVVPMYRFSAAQEKALGQLMHDAARWLSSRLGARLLGGASAGTWQDAVGMISTLLKKHAPALGITPALGGGGRNLEGLERGEGAYALTTASSVFDACTGRAQFAHRLQSLRTVMNLAEVHLLLIARAGVTVKTMADFARLRVSPGEQGFSAVQALEDALQCAGITPGKSRRKGSALLYLDYPEGKRQLEAGMVDALVWISGASNPLVRELADSSSSRLVEMERPVLDRMLQLNPGYRRGMLPRSAFPHWLDSDLQVLTVSTVLVCRADRPEEEVYELARTLYQQRETLGQMSSAYQRLDAQFAVAGLTAPMHPGAERFFRELGVEPDYASGL